MSAAATSPAGAPQIDEAKLHAFVGKMIGDVGATLTGALVLLGDRLGFYRALAEHGPMTSAALAQRTDTAERYVREWLANQAASGYLEYDPRTEHFTLPPEHQPVLADESSPVLLCGLYQVAQVLFADEPRSPRRSGAGAASAGTSTTSGSSPPPSASSGPATTPTSSRAGFPRSTASRRSCAEGRASPTWVAATAPPPS